MTNISDLLSGKYLPITTVEATKLHWYCRIKFKDSIGYFKIYESKNVSTGYKLTFRLWSNNLNAWLANSFDVEINTNGFITYVGEKSQLSKHMQDLVFSYDSFESLLISHEKLNEDGDIFQLYLSGSSLDIDLENYKGITLC